LCAMADFPSVRLDRKLTDCRIALGSTVSHRLGSDTTNHLIGFGSGGGNRTPDTRIMIPLL
jgi:hypothetical protein